MKRFQRRSAVVVAALLAGCVANSIFAADVSLMINGAPAKVGDNKPSEVTSLVMASGDLVVTFGKDANGDFSATSVVKAGKELAHNLKGVEPRDVDRSRTFYLDSGAGGGHLFATNVRVVKSSPEMVHFAVIDDGVSQPMPAVGPAATPRTRGGAAPATATAPGAAAAAAGGVATAPAGRRGGGGGGGGGRRSLEHHFIMRSDSAGVYAYAIVNTPGAGGEMRTMYRFDRDILDKAWTAERVGVQPRYRYLQDLEEKDPANLVQDETWKLPDGYIYQKYDYCAYYSESPMWGHFGNGMGVFFIPVSNEYYAGGPFREELIVHQDALILNYIGGGHFSGGGPATTDKAKMFGPWLLYFNTGGTEEAIVADAKKKAAEEQGKWPYQWVDEKLYPTKRAKVTGQLRVADAGKGQTAAGAWVILAKPGNVYTQGGDFIFYTHADASGKFELPHVRPGVYALHAYATQGSITTELEKAGIEVKEGAAAVDLGAVEWKGEHHANLLWQMGKSDRMSGEFKYGNELRNIQWVRSVPANLTFTIGKSKEAEDWYYAQAKPGNWDVVFNLDKVPSGKAYLTVALAGGGGGPSVDVLVNGKKVSEQPIAPGNDASTYRSAVRSGRYGRTVLTFDASVLKAGENMVRFTNTAAGNRTNDIPSNGLMWDTILLESD